MRRERSEKSLAPAAIGSANELVVCADLMTRGMDVYKAVSPGAPYDLLVIFAGLILKVEVTTRRGSICSTHAKKLRRREVDVVAVVETFSAKITYVPDLQFAAMGERMKQQRARKRP